MLYTIKSKFILNLSLALASLFLVVLLAYLIAVDKVHAIMVNDITSVSTSLQKTLLYISNKDEGAYSDEKLKKQLYDIRIGKSGYVYLIDSDGTLLIHPKKEGKSLKETDYGSYITSHKEGGIYEYTSVTTGQNKIAAFAYIPIWDAWIVPGVNKADYFEDLKSEFLWYFTILLLVLSSVLIVLNYLTGRSILNSVDKINAVTVDLNEGNGDLSQRLPTGKTTDELSVLIENINTFISMIDSTVFNVRHSSSYQTSLSEALTSLTHELRTKTNESDMMAKSTVEYLDKIRGALDETVQSSSEIFEVSQESKRFLEHTTQSLENITSMILNTAESTNELNTEFSQLISDVENLKEITGVIRDISDQTNLLALNAAIEAARAGEHGRGFAVVAEEVRSLSDRTNKAINEVDASLSAFVESMSSATSKIESNSNTVKELVEEGEDVKGQFARIDDAISLNVKNSKENLDVINKMKNNIVSIIEQIQYISALSFEKSSFINEVDEIAGEVKDTDRKIGTYISFFKLSKTPTEKKYIKKQGTDEVFDEDILF